MQTIQSWVDKMGERGAAKKLVDTFLAKQTGGMTSSDMGDTATFASGLDDIESFLEEGDFEGAMTAAKDTASDMLHDEGFGSEFGMNENFKRNNTKMKNSKKEVLKDLRDVSFNRLVEAYYNMNETDTFIVKESNYMEENSYEEGYGNPMMDEDSYDEGYDVHGGMMDEEDYMEEDLFEEEEGDFHQHARDISYRPKFSGSEKPSMRTARDGSRYSYEKMGRDTIMKDYPSSEDEMYGSQDEDIMYEVEMGHQDFNMSERMTDDEVSEMLDEMDGDKIIHDVEETSNFSKMQKGAKSSDLEEMFQEMTTQELEEMSALLEDGDGEFEDQGVLPEKRTSKFLHDASDVEEDYSNLTEAEIEEMLDSMNEEDLEEGIAITKQTQRNVGPGKNRGGEVEGRPERRSGMNEEDMSEIKSLKEKLAKVQKEKESLQEGFVNKVKTLENKVYDVTISALKAGFVNKFLLEHPLRENEKLQIIHRFSNAQTKEQIKETYISLTNEFAKGQTVKDGSMLNESIQNKVGKVHRTDNAVVREKNLINENDESLRFKQLLNYNFGKKK
jgi:hypothetical protein